MSANVTKRMLQEYLKSEVDERLLQYVAENAHEVLYILPEQLYEKAGIDESQAQAFFQAFGVDSFLAFKYILRKCLYYEVRDQKVEKRSLNSLADEVFRMELHNLTTMAARLDCEQVERLAEDILNASEVDLFYSAAMRPIAKNLYRMLNLMDVHPKEFVKFGRTEFNDLDSIPSSGLVIVFGRMRYSLRMLMEIKQLKQRGMKIVCLTDRYDSPFIPVADYSFVLPTVSYDFTDSSVSGTALVHILSLCIGMKREEAMYSKMHQRAIETQENNMFW